MAKPFAKLRGKLIEKDIDQAYLCELLKKSQTYVTQRMTGKAPWSQDDQYIIMDECNILYAEMHMYFTKNGQNEAGVHRVVRLQSKRRGA